jgi:uncharacterized membrane protein
VLTKGPAYIIFPIICLSPVVTIILSATLLKERTYPLALTGIILSIPAILFLSLRPPTARFTAMLGSWLRWPSV